MTPEERTQVWKEAVEWQKSQQLVDLFRASDKCQVIKALFGKASRLAKECKDPVRAKELEAYSEGFRHVLNIMKTLGSGLAAYHNIATPYIDGDGVGKIPLTQEDVDLMGR
jgi:hypothetical protein